MSSTLRGHAIAWDKTLGRWVFLDTLEPTIETHAARPCACCGLHATSEGHDACLGTLPGSQMPAVGMGTWNRRMFSFWRVVS
jgi:hypothetical protein